MYIYLCKPRSRLDPTKLAVLLHHATIGHFQEGTFHLRIMCIYILYIDYATKIECITILYMFAHPWPLVVWHQNFPSGNKVATAIRLSFERQQRHWLSFSHGLQPKSDGLQHVLQISWLIDSRHPLGYQQSVAALAPTSPASLTFTGAPKSSANNSYKRRSGEVEVETNEGNQSKCEVFHLSIFSVRTNDPFKMLSYITSLLLMKTSLLRTTNKKQFALMLFSLL